MVEGSLAGGGGGDRFPAAEVTVPLTICGQRSNNLCTVQFSIWQQGFLFGAPSPMGVLSSTLNGWTLRKTWAMIDCLACPKDTSSGLEGAPAYILTCFRASKSQIFSRASSEPVSTYFPLGENLASDTGGFSLSVMVLRHFPVSVSHNLTRLSMLELSIIEPSLLKSTHVTGSE